MLDVLPVLAGATRVCDACLLRFARAECPRCGRPPRFTSFDADARRWLHASRRRARVSPAGVITGVSTIASLGMLGVGHPLLAMGLFGLGTIAGLVPRFQHGVIADAFLEVERADPFFDLSELDRVRGVIASDPPVTPRARRYAIEGLFGGVRAADILGPSMILRSGDDVVEVAWDRARVHVDGPVRERGLRRAGVSPTQRRALWLEGHIKGRLRAIALHDGFEVEITGDVQVLSGTREEQVGYRSAPRRLVVRPHDGAMRVRVIKGEDVR